MKKIFYSTAGKILGASIAIVLTIVLTLMASSHTAGESENQLKTNTENIKGIMTVQLPAIYKELGDLRVTDMQNSTRYEAIDKRLEAQNKMLERLLDRESRKSQIILPR